MTTRTLITSLDQIPSSFGSEDEEREWWAEHEFSDQLLRELPPDWDALPGFSMAARYANRTPQVEYLLDVARKHARLVRAEREAPFRNDARLEHAIIAITFAASAVETALNLYFTLPRFRMKGGEVVEPEPPEETRWPARKKLHTVAKRCEEIRDEALLERVEALLARRDNLVHAMPTSGGPSPDDVARAREHYEAAAEFTRRLVLPAAGHAA